MAKISVILTSYNCVNFIVAAIASVAAQTERDLEILVIDDGSTDGTLEAAQAVARADARVRVCPLHHGGKASIARNAGLSLAGGEYICFLDADDLYHATRIERAAQFLDQHRGTDAVFHDLQLIDEAGAITAASFLRKYDFPRKAAAYLRRVTDDTHICSRDFYLYMALGHSSVHTSSIMVRHSLIKQQALLFSEDVKMAEDIEFWWKVAQGREIGYIDQPLASYRIHGANSTRDLETLYRDSLTVHGRNRAACHDALSDAQRRQYAHKVADIWFSLGYFCAINQRRREARAHYAKAISTSFEPRFVLAYLKTLAPRMATPAAGARDGNH